MQHKPPLRLSTHAHPEVIPTCQRKTAFSIPARRSGVLISRLRALILCLLTGRACGARSPASLRRKTGRLASRVPRRGPQPTANTAGGAEDEDREWKQQLLPPRQTNLQSQRVGLEEERTGESGGRGVNVTELGD